MKCSLASQLPLQITRTYLCWGNLGRCVLTSQDYHTPDERDGCFSQLQSALVKAVPNEPKFPVISRQLRLAKAVSSGHINTAAGSQKLGRVPNNEGEG